MKPEILLRRRPGWTRCNQTQSVRLTKERCSIWSRSCKLLRLAAVASTTLFATSAQAELVYSSDKVFDTESNLSWKAFEILDAGAAAGYAAASVAQTSELFLHYAPPDSEGVLPGYTPTSGGVTDYVTSSDGTSFAISWQSSYYFVDDYQAPSLLDAFGANISYASVGPYSESGIALIPLIADGETWLPVLLRSTGTANQYGDVWGVEEGAINPDSSLIPIDGIFYECRDFCYEIPNPYFDDTGALKLGGYLMVSSVPEPSNYALFLLGAGSVMLFAQRRRRAQ